ncbi:MAG: MerR family transcriptional regulator, partial [Desulfobacterales bacterium]|nr:MerR family transcriptional regulator [Desulfobacterales bacterium]
MDQSNSYFTISDLAKELDVKKSHIRFCEENGLISPRASKLKRRVYNRYDRERLKLVFHFVLLGYSKEQIIGLIGIPDSNLDENDQLMQGIEYASKELRKLEKRKEELSFTKQTRTINEIEMLREYINKIKSIKSGVLEELSARPSIRFEEKTKIPTKPITAITAEAQKKITQHPVKVFSLFVAGLALVILVGSYFYYQAGQKETKTIKLVQKKPIHSEKFLVSQAPVPVDQIAKTQAAVQETQKLTQSSSDSQQGSLKAKLTKSLPDSTQTVKIAPVTDDVSLVPEKEKLGSPKVEEAPKDDVQKEVAGEDLSEKAAPAAVGEDTLTAAVPEPGVEKVAETEVKPSLTESEKEMEQITSEEDINQQKNELSRLKSFLDEYCQAYTNKDLDKFITLFTSDATENNKPFHELLPDYRNNMEGMESLTYRIELMSYSKQTASGNLIIRGRFFTRYQSQKGV